MGANLTTHSDQIHDACTLAAMSAATGCGYRYDIKEHRTWELKRVTSGDCALCKDNERRATWREVTVCGHRFHRSCLRDHRRIDGPKCPTCNSSYSEITKKKVLVHTAERVDTSSWVSVGYAKPSTTITFSEGSTTPMTKHDTEIAKMISSKIQSSSDSQIHDAVVNALCSALENEARFSDARKSRS